MDAEGLLFKTFPTLETDRLRLREARMVDAGDFLVFCGDAYVQRFNAAPLKGIGEATAFLHEQRQLYVDRSECLWAVELKAEAKVIGIVSMQEINFYHRRAEIGYSLARAYWRRGIGSEAVTAVIRFAFLRLAFNRLEAATIADNYESVAMLERLGFQREGTRRGFSWEDDGTFHDSAMYGLLRAEAGHLTHQEPSHR